MTATLLLALAVFGASSVEAVEALTIVLAAGATRGYRPALYGALSAVGVLTVAVGTVGVPLVRFVPLDVLQACLGAALLYLGGTWLRKAVLRTSGRKAIHTEEERYQETVESKGSGFGLAFSGVLVEGMEVVLIVLTLGASSHRLGAAALAAGAAIVLVSCAGVLLSRPLTKIPETTIKACVGVLLVSFGIFWAGEGFGLAWPGRDLMLLALIAAAGLASRASIVLLRRGVA